MTDSTAYRYCRLNSVRVNKASSLGRPTYMSADLRFTTELNHMVGSKCNMKTHVQTLRCLLSLQIQAPKPPFWTTSQRPLKLPLSWTTSQLNGNFNGLWDLSWEWNMVYISGQVRCKLQWVSYTVSKRRELWPTKGFKLEMSFHRPSVNSAFHFIARLRRRRSAKGTQPNFAKRWTVNRANNPT